MADSSRHRPSAFDVLTAPVTLLVGHFGAGKSEIAVNLAFGWRRRGAHVTLVDLDLVKPYFRSRLLRDEMAAQGIHVVLPEDDRVFADLPIVVPAARAVAVAGHAAGPGDRFIVDVGGADVGSRVVGSLPSIADPAVADVLFVVNGNRPFAETPDAVVAMLREVEHAARVRVTGLVANTHLIDETTPEIVEAGLRLAAEVAARIGLPVRFFAALEGMAAAANGLGGELPLLPLTRFITPPIGWRIGPARRRSSLV
jgi:hypothetical protein